MVRRRGIGAALTLIAATAAPAVAQTPTPTATGEPITITLTAAPHVQTADFRKTITLSGKVTGGDTLAAALADHSLTLNVTAVANGYNRRYDVAPIKPKADGTFTRKLDAAVNASISVAPEGNRFTGTSPTVRTHWVPVPEIFNFTKQDNKVLVINYSASIPGGIPFISGSFRMKRGTATKAYFYAGPKKAIGLIGTAPLKSAYDGEIHAKFAVPFKDLPPGGGRVYACVKGTAFLATDPMDPKCGGKTSLGHIEPRQP